MPCGARGACFVARSEHPGGALGLTYRRYLSMRGPIIEKKGLRGWSSRCSRLSALWFLCPGVPREAMNFPCRWFGCGIERGLSCPACETRDGRCASSRLILEQGAEAADWEVLSNEREVGERVRRSMEVGERACRLTGVETSDPPGEKAGVQNACACQKS